mgnify:CR=1 FL=1
MNDTESSDDWWNELSEELKKEIQQGLKDIEEGRVIPHEEVRVKYRLNKTPFGN